LTPAAQFLHNVSRDILSRAAQASAYAKWPDDFARKEVREAWTGENRGWDLHLTVAQLQTLTPDERERFGFGLWDDAGPVLLPLWAFNIVADGETLFSINGATAVKGQDEIDLDVRFGCIAWGFAL
jgi:hypothetical protein